MSFALGAALGSAHSANRDLAAWQQSYYKLENLRNQDLQSIADLRSDMKGLEMSMDKWKLHHASEKALRIAAMEALDKASGGADKNPLRKQAYADADAMRIPSGDRKGKVMTMADHIYVSKFAEAFKGFASKYSNVRSWKDFLHTKVSY